MQQKKAQKDYELLVNDDHMKKWVELTDQQDNERRQREEQNKLKKLEVKEYLLMQMGDEKVVDANGSVGSAVAKKRVKQNSAGEGHMTAEELRLNKQLLKEISRKKKEKVLVGGSDINSQLEMSVNYN